MTRLAASACVLLFLVVAVDIGALMLLFRGGISARAEPSALEASLATRMRRLGLRDARDRPNPIPRTREVVAQGLAHFADHCAVCHANDGSGQTEIGGHLYPRAPDMRRSATQELTDGELFAIIENGVRFTGMPAWGDGSADSQRASWHLVHFIRHLPQRTTEEILEMKALNPKSPDEWREEQEEERFLEGGEPARPESHEGHHH